MDSFLQTQLIPKEQTDLLAPYRVSDAFEAIALFKRLRDEHTLITLYASAGGNFLVTTLVSVDTQRSELHFDFSTDNARRKSFRSTGHATAVAYLDNVKIQFDLVIGKDESAHAPSELICPYPKEVFRLQRRGTYRVRPLMSQPALCWVRDQKSPGQREPLRLIDISLGGIAMLAAPTQLELSMGARMEGTVIELPGHERFACDLIVRYIDDSSRMDAEKLRCGCEFLGLSGSVMRLVQLYVNEVEKRRRAAESRE